MAINHSALNLPGHGSLDDVRIGEAARCGDALNVDLPDPRQIFAILWRCRTCDSRVATR